MRCLIGLFLAAAAFGQSAGSPDVINARFESRPFSGNLSSQVISAGPAWFGYAIKTARGNHDSCCWGANGYGCSLEQNRSESFTSRRSTEPVKLEGSDSIALLFRVENSQIQKIQIYSLNCQLDAGGLPFTWLTGVPAPQSVAFLDTLVHKGDSHGMENTAILALSMHDSPIALDTLIQIAKQDASPHVREQALFWLAQKAGERASAAITDAILNDPDTSVKKHAVFALSQLPKDEGVPKLIEVARSQRNLEVRKQAFFWLGQSKDPRAVAFFQEILTK